MLGNARFPDATARRVARTVGRSAVAALVVLTAASARAQSTTLVDFKDISPHELRSAGFVLSEPQRVRIEAVGAEHRVQRGKLWEKLFDRSNDDSEQWWRGNAWILDADTRRVVWELRESDTKGESDGLRRFDGAVRLPAGAFEVYFASYTATSYSTEGDGGSWVLGRLRGRNAEPRRYDDGGLSERFKLVVRGDGRRGTDPARGREAITNRAIVAFTSVEAGDSRRLGFALERPTEVEIYAMGEARPDEAFDYGWIINADTRQRVWTFGYDHSEPAGGADKNRMVRAVRTLPAGRYAAFFVTDDSHDPGDWNAAPPYDPLRWGLTVRLTNPADADRVTTFRYESAPPGDAIVAMTGIGDSEARSRGFTLTRPMDVRVYALGEGTGGRMVDYGWITEVSTRRRVWEMRLDDTEHAGGSDKNRMVDKVVRLPAGDYMVHYVSDDSHSASDWNAAAPIDGDMWGISVFAGDEADRESVRPYDERDDSSVLAQLVRMHDDEHARARFTLERDGDVRVYAIGEGTSDDMFDYAWIEDARTGRAVWEMSYRNSAHAGGADKNRFTDDVIRLRAGEYVVHYKSDSSHSFGDWNADPPDDPVSWGVTVRRVR